MTAANAKITATTAESTVQENNDAIVTFHLSTPLTSSTTVKASLAPQGGATSSDYSGFQYHMGTGTGGWLDVPSDGVISLNTGFDDFQLKTSLTYDTITEPYDALAFTVAQTTSSVGLDDSWWVPSLVHIQDAVGTGTAASTRSITASTTTTGVEGSATLATATFLTGGSGATYADTQVRVTMYGVGGATPSDYQGNFKYDVGAGWVDVPVGGLIDIGRNVSSFKLGILAASDSNTETGEGISFNVAQTTSSVGLVDSWWVPNIVDLQDAQGTGASAYPRSIAATTPVTAVEGAVDWTGGGAPGIATYHLSGSGADYADTEVRVSLYGLGGAIPSDFSGFKYHLGSAASAAGNWTDVPNDGLITIGRGIADFQLASYAVSDNNSETGEGISFNVAQTTSSVGLVDSWWVPSIVDLKDAPGTGASAYPRTITAGTPVTGVEGNVDWTTAASHPAIATFNVTGGGTPNYADTVVRVSMYGTGGAVPTDYFDFKYRTTDGVTWSAWADATNNGTIPVNHNTTAFQLASYPTLDSTAETGEGISFTVAQTTSSVGLVDSWWVQSTADIVDAVGFHVVTGAIGPDHFTGTAAADKFVIPAGTSKAFADGATGLNGSDVYFTSGESFDTITGFVAGTDKIDLPVTGTDTTFTFSSTVTGFAATEYDLIGNLQTYSTALGASGIVKLTVTNSSDVYFLVNTSGDGTWDAANDTLIKIVGGGSVTAADFV